MKFLHSLLCFSFGLGCILVYSACPCLRNESLIFASLFVSSVFDRRIFQILGPMIWKMTLPQVVLADE